MRNQLLKAQPVVYRLPDGLTIVRQKDKWSILDEVWALSHCFKWIYMRNPSSMDEDLWNSCLYNSAEEAYKHWEEFCEKK